MDPGGLPVLRTLARHPRRPGIVHSAETPAGSHARLPPKPADDSAGPAPLQPKADDADVVQLPASQVTIIGPFTVLSVGNRLGDAKVMQAAKIPQLQENVLGIRVSAKVPGEAEKAAILWDRLQAVNFRQIGIQRHGK